MLIAFWFRSVEADLQQVFHLPKLLNPLSEVIGMQDGRAACMKASLKKGEVVTLPHVNTIANDGTAVLNTEKSLYIQKNLDIIITIEG